MDPPDSTQILNGTLNMDDRYENKRTFQYNPSYMHSRDATLNDIFVDLTGDEFLCLDNPPMDINFKSERSPLTSCVEVKEEKLGDCELEREKMPTPVINEVSSMIEKMKSTNKNLKERNMTYESLIAELEENLSEKMTSLMTTEMERDSLAENLKKADDERCSLKLRVEEAEAELIQLREYAKIYGEGRELLEVKKELENLKKMHQKTKNDLEKTNTQLAEKRASARKLKLSNTRMTKFVSELFEIAENSGFLTSKLRKMFSCIINKYPEDASKSHSDQMIENSDDVNEKSINGTLNKTSEMEHEINGTLNKSAEMADEINGTLNKSAEMEDEMDVTLTQVKDSSVSFQFSSQVVTSTPFQHQDLQSHNQTVVEQKDSIANNKSSDSLFFDGELENKSAVNLKGSIQTSSRMKDNKPSSEETERSSINSNQMVESSSDEFDVTVEELEKIRAQVCMKNELIAPLSPLPPTPPPKRRFLKPKPKVGVNCSDFKPLKSSPLSLELHKNSNFVSKKNALCHQNSGGFETHGDLPSKEGNQQDEANKGSNMQDTNNSKISTLSNDVHLNFIQNPLTSLAANVSNTANCKGSGILLQDHSLSDSTSKTGAPTMKNCGINSDINSCPQSETLLSSNISYIGVETINDMVLINARQNMNYDCMVDFENMENKVVISNPKRNQTRQDRIKLLMSAIPKKRKLSVDDCGSSFSSLCEESKNPNENILKHQKRRKSCSNSQENEIAFMDENVKNTPCNSSLHKNNFMNKIPNEEPPCNNFLIHRNSLINSNHDGNTSIDSSLMHKDSFTYENQNKSKSSNSSVMHKNSFMNGNCNESALGSNSVVHKDNLTNKKHNESTPSDSPSSLIHKNSFMNRNHNESIPSNSSLMHKNSFIDSDHNESTAFNSSVMHKDTFMIGNQNGTTFSDEAKISVSNQTNKNDFVNVNCKKSTYNNSQKHEDRVINENLNQSDPSHQMESVSYRSLQVHENTAKKIDDEDIASNKIEVIKRSLKHDVIQTHQSTFIETPNILASSKKGNSLDFGSCPISPVVNNCDKDKTTDSLPISDDSSTVDYDITDSLCKSRDIVNELANKPVDTCNLNITDHLREKQSMDPDKFDLSELSDTSKNTAEQIFHMNTSDSIKEKLECATPKNALKPSSPKSGPCTNSSRSALSKSGRKSPCSLNAVRNGIYHKNTPKRVSRKSSKRVCDSNSSDDNPLDGVLSPSKFKSPNVGIESKTVSKENFNVKSPESILNISTDISSKNHSDLNVSVDNLVQNKILAMHKSAEVSKISKGSPKKTCSQSKSRKVTPKRASRKISKSVCDLDSSDDNFTEKGVLSPSKFKSSKVGIESKTVSKENFSGKSPESNLNTSTDISSKTDSDLNVSVDNSTQNKILATHKSAEVSNISKSARKRPCSQSISRKVTPKRASRKISKSVCDSDSSDDNFLQNGVLSSSKFKSPEVGSESKTVSKENFRVKSPESILNTSTDISSKKDSDMNVSVDNLTHNKILPTHKSAEVSNISKGTRKRPCSQNLISRKVTPKRACRKISKSVCDSDSSDDNFPQNGVSSPSKFKSSEVGIESKTVSKENFPVKSPESIFNSSIDISSKNTSDLNVSVDNLTQNKILATGKSAEVGNTSKVVRKRPDSQYVPKSVFDDISCKVTPKRVAHKNSKSVCNSNSSDDNVPLNGVLTSAKFRLSEVGIESKTISKENFSVKSPETIHDISTDISSKNASDLNNSVDNLAQNKILVASKSAEISNISNVAHKSPNSQNVPKALLEGISPKVTPKRVAHKKCKSVSNSNSSDDNVLQNGILTPSKFGLSEVGIESKTISKGNFSGKSPESIHDISPDISSKNASDLNNSVDNLAENKILVASKSAEVGNISNVARKSPNSQNVPKALLEGISRKVTPKRVAHKKSKSVSDSNSSDDNVPQNGILTPSKFGLSEVDIESKTISKENFSVKSPESIHDISTDISSKNASDLNTSADNVTQNKISTVSKSAKVNNECCSISKEDVSVKSSNSIHVSNNISFKEVGLNASTDNFIKDPVIPPNKLIEVDKASNNISKEDISIKTYASNHNISNILSSEEANLNASADNLIPSQITPQIKFKLTEVGNVSSNISKKDICMQSSNSIQNISNGTSSEKANLNASTDNLMPHEITPPNKFKLTEVGNVCSNYQKDSVKLSDSIHNGNAVDLDALLDNLTQNQRLASNKFGLFKNNNSFNKELNAKSSDIVNVSESISSKKSSDMEASSSNVTQNKILSLNKVAQSKFTDASKNSSEEKILKSSYSNLNASENTSEENTQKKGLLSYSCQNNLSLPNSDICDTNTSAAKSKTTAPHSINIAPTIDEDSMEYDISDSEHALVIDVSHEEEKQESDVMETTSTNSGIGQEENVAGVLIHSENKAPANVEKKKKKKKKKNEKLKSKKNSKLKTIKDESKSETIDSVTEMFAKLEDLKFDDTHYKRYIHMMVVVLINPANARDNVALIYQIANYLSVSRRNPLLSYSISKNETFTLPVIEKCIVSALIQIEKKKKSHLIGLLRSAVKSLSLIVLAKEKMSCYGLSAMCRVVTEICKHMQNCRKPVELCCDLLIMKHKYAPFLIASVIGVWGELFHTSADTPSDEMLLKSCIVYGLEERFPDLTEAQWKQCSVAISHLFDAPPIASIEKTVSYLKERFESIFQDGEEEEFMLMSSALILSARLGWNWANEYLVKDFILPKMIVFAVEEENERAFSMLSDLYSSTAVYASNLEEPISALLEYFKLKFDGEGFAYVHHLSACSLMKLLVLKEQRIPDCLSAWIEENQAKLVNSPIELLMRRRLLSLTSDIVENDIVV